MAANATQNHDAVLQDLRKQLAVAVRSIQWSYAIFWSSSTSQQGLLVWGDGYYNGDIKTRKTVQALEIKADKIGLQRSEQLRELYESLLEGESEQANKRPSVALSPEDLTDAEWYYLVCMSFVFNTGQGLPGRVFANGETIWLCNAQYADSKVFSRSLLAKSASIQTVVCFPHLDGVIELGVTELIPEDPSLLQHVKASLLDFSKPVCSEKSSSPSHNADDDNDPICTKISHEIVDALTLESLYSSREEIKFDSEGADDLQGNINEEFHLDSPDERSKGCEHNHQTEDSFMLEGINGGASQVQSWHFMDDDFSNGLPDSMNSSDCISEAFVHQAKVASSPKHENVGNFQLKELQDGNHTKLSSLDLGADDDSHYKKTLSAILASSNRLTENLCFFGCGNKSSFMSWKKVGKIDGHRLQVQQSILKQILFTVPLMYGGCPHKSQKEICRKNWRTTIESDDFCTGHVSSSDKRRENEKFMVLRSMVPSVCKVDKTSILNDTIKYLKKLEARVEELESCMDSAVDFEARPKRNHPDMVEQIFDNYDNQKIDNGRKPWINKRKASDIDETDLQINKVVLKDGPPLDVKVSIKEKEVLIEMRCPYREFILLDIMDAINNLHLDAYSVISANLDGILTLALKSKFQGAAVAPAVMIEQALWKVAGTPAYYVIVQIGTQVHKSKVSSAKGGKAWWNEKFRFVFPQSDWRKFTHIKFRIMDVKSFTDNGFVGETIYYLGGIISEGNDKGLIEVNPAPHNVVLEDDTYKGQIKVGFKFIMKEEKLMQTREFNIVQENLPRKSSYIFLVNLWKKTWFRLLHYRNRTNSKNA
ncbi:transcription factor GLABRA 3-like [Mangifera indica]|uniref:transcription factor GLABRA 3-like n=1 Tax=Mangifera indica TaxID=29780 RepID=UPI001CFB226F|nr:transcription factor GLABRA 3-like [Mangifera indica]